MAKSKGKLQMEPTAEEEQDYCQNLPNDLLVNIFTKLLVNSSLRDLKFICRCSLVSKRFNSTISLIPIISLKSHMNPSFGGFRRRPQINKKIVEKIVAKFHNLQSLYIEYNELGSDLKWKAVYRSGIYYFVALQKFNDCKQLYYEIPPRYGFNFGPLYHRESIFFMMKFHETIVLLIRKHKMLSNVIISDFDGNGKICLGYEEIEELRNDRGYGNAAFRLPAYVQFGVVPELCVPLFGFSTKRVEFFAFKSGDKARDSYIDDIMNWDFDEKEKEFGEALKFILRNHKDKLWSSKCYSF